MASTNATTDSDNTIWQAGKSLPGSHLYMLENQVDCDVTFRIHTQAGSVQTVPAHKFMLVARSPVFEQMFRDDKEVASQDLNVCDVEVEPFKEMMRFIYSGKIRLTGEHVMDIMYSAKKYQVEGLEEECEQYISGKISINNVAQIFSGSVKYNEDKWMNKYLGIMTKRTQQVIQTDGFTKMSQDALLKFLECDLHPNNIEVDIYIRCLTWAREQLNAYAGDDEIRAALGKCLYQIRFHQMPKEKFAEVAGSGNVLNADEKSNIIFLMMTNNDNHREFLAKQGFNMNSRVFRLDRFFSHISANTCYIKTSPEVKEVFKFVVDEPVSVHGVSICNGKNGSKHTVSITIEDTSQKRQVCKHNTETIFVSHGKFSEILIPKIELEPKKYYKISIMVKGDKPITYGSRQNKNVSIQSINGVTIIDETMCWPAQGRTGYFYDESVGCTNQVLLSKLMKT